MTSELDVLRSDLAESRLGRSAAATADAAVRAWPTSAARTFVNDTIGGYQRLTPVERVRVTGVWAVTAALTVGILALFDPRPVSGPRWGLWAAFLVLGATAAVWAGPATKAWTEWRVRPALQRRTGRETE